MDNNQDWKNLGEQILDSVAGALNTGDFRQLNNLVSGTVDTVVQEAKRQANLERMNREEILRQYRENSAINREKWLAQQAELNRRREERREEWRKLREAQQYQFQRNRDDSQSGVRTLPPPPRFTGVRFKKAGSAGSVLKIVFGALGIGISAGLGILTLILFATGNSWLPLGIFTALGLAISGNLLKSGIKHQELIKRAQRYIQICGTKMYADLSQIAAQTGTTVKFVKKDIKKMLRAGMFPEGHMDLQETCLILSNEVYRQYTETAEAFKMRDQMQADANRVMAAAEQEAKEKQERENELDALMREGTQYVQKLRQLNEAIPGEEISAQLSQLESLLKQIFDRVKDHPEQMHRMQKLMEYYLPTTIKLVEAYVQFEKVENPGQDIRDAKAEIKKTLGIINEAFTELLNNLFQDEVFDATTDAQVLQAMLSREGLRREMSLQAEPLSEEEELQERVQYAQTEEEEEDSPFQLSLEPEQPEIAPALKAPWES